VIARVLGGHPQRREVTSRVRLGVALTPKLLAAEDLRKESLLLSIGPKLHDQRTDHRETKYRYPQGADHFQLLVENETLGGVPTRTTELLRPVGRDPSLGVKDLVPFNGLLEIEASRSLRGATELVGHCLVHPGANLLTKRLFFLGEGEIHDCVHDTTSASAPFTNGSGSGQIGGKKILPSGWTTANHGQIFVLLVIGAVDPELAEGLGSVYVDVHGCALDVDVANRFRVSVKECLAANVTGQLTQLWEVARSPQDWIAALSTEHRNVNAEVPVWGECIEQSTDHVRADPRHISKGDEYPIGVVADYRDAGSDG